MLLDQSLEQHFIGQTQVPDIDLAVAFELVAGIAALTRCQFLFDRLEGNLRRR